jgi:uncharacterized protein (PEP-CTERM system associated)
MNCMAPHEARRSCAKCGWLCRVGVAAVLGLARTQEAAAFPLIDPTNLDQVPHGTELAAPDVSDLRHQLQIVNGLGAPAGGGWLFVPRFDFQEMLTDNVLDQHSPRKADLVSYFAPGFSLAGDLPRISLRLSYAPVLQIYTQTGSLNALTQQLNGIGSVTVVPDFAFIDVRGLSGVQNANGGVGGLGTIGATSAATAQTTTPSLAGNGEGLNRNNEVQTASFGVSPYLLHSFGDWGTGKLGYSADVTRSNRLSGFASAPFPSGGATGQTLFSNEENAHYVTGEIMEKFQDSLDFDMLQSRTTQESGSINPNTGLNTAATTHFSSTREVITNQISYRLNRSISVFAAGGHEDIVYTGPGGQSIHDLTWNLGTTLTPNPDSQLTVSYGHQNGFNAFAANGYYALTTRTLISVSYGSTLGTQLENLRNQLNLATTNSNGTLVNGQTGGQLFGATNALPVQNGVFRTDTLTVGSQTTLDRDIITFNVLLAKQTTTGGSVSTTGNTKTFSATWIHQMQPDMIFNALMSYSLQDQNLQAGPGNSTSVVAGLGWQYQISDTVSTSLRYSFFQRRSAASAFDIYQNSLILGISKTF